MAVERTALDWNHQGSRRRGQPRHGQESRELCMLEILCGGPMFQIGTIGWINEYPNAIHSTQGFS